MTFKELRKALEADGWYIVRTNRHHQYLHPTKQPLNGRPIAVGLHDRQEVPAGTLHNILKNAGLK